MMNKKKRLPVDPLAMVLPIGMLLIWISCSYLELLPTYLFPGPMRMFHVGWDFLIGTGGLTPYSGSLLNHLVASVTRVLMGFSIAAFWGILLGLLSGRNERVHRLLDPTIQMLRAVPGIGWLPLAMIWFGVGQQTTVFLIALAAFFPIYLNVAHGAARIPKELIQAAQMMGADARVLLRTVVIPASFPSMLVGLRLGMGIAWAYLVLGELTGVANGLGSVMMDARMLGQIEMIPITMISIAIMGKLCDTMLVKLARKLHAYPEMDR
jgi:NitT/TauT family transport system permease protein